MTETRAQSDKPLVSRLFCQIPVVFVFISFLAISPGGEAGETPPDPRAAQSKGNDPGYSAPPEVARTCIDISEARLPKDAISVFHQFADDKCAEFKSRKIDRKTYRQNLYHGARYLGICTLKTKLRSTYLQKLRRENQPDNIVKIYSAFCGRVVDDNGVMWITDAGHWEWLSTNLFCTTLREVVSPAGWRGVVLQSGTQSYKRLEAVTYNLCGLLRSKKLDLNEVIFQFEEEVNLYDQQVGTNHAESLLTFMRDFYN